MKRIRDYGINIGTMKTGKYNKITDVPGVKVGHYTIMDEKHNTGITVILPCEDNIFINKMMASSHIINGYGKTCGLIQVEELGYIETPIVLTNTLNIGKMHDALIGYMIEKCNEDGIEVKSINPVIGEVNDSKLNDIQDRCLGEKELKIAIDDAKVDFIEGSIGAGTGTICCNLKGGIGSSSRTITLDQKEYTVGVLVQTNFGGDLIIDGKKVGLELKDKINNMEKDRGSIMIILATDIPLTERQLKRVIKRCEIGLIRTGSNLSNTSGDIVIGFSTANRLNQINNDFREIKSLNENKIEYLFRMASEATEEAILNSLVTSTTVKWRSQVTSYSLKDIYLKDI